jgi:cAMP-dependent protein kinase regulator
VSVSAEVYGNFNKKEDFTARVIPKSEQAKSRIKSRMEQAFMFSVLDDKEKDIVIGSMEEKKFSSGEWVIK